ncbi:MULTISPECIES: J domain-containing protein [unclassified Microcystis]|jgi:preprotein translocase subunit Sec63|uniref:Molecular chaperone DnaJ n=1 Tax=Microcystis aeruginosa Ma_QC_Ca_00000000_S207 TaxID=2486251 RepID=A0A552FLT1_MICAE|nr:MULTISPECIES: J domain-containing protein [unclassified Microcystis]MCA2925921.1 J domain-containing protein [Microcystis sp. M020S1]MCA2935189.1 J domain-containing protein [Microcystis sp. M015S1]TRU47692.1 MAG: molecular chaperone DnaJ [Microcystis aeruginosa Ma_QC_Ca_00000000_S207]MCA2621820.1 J domain-containing protein [Microcystis sp. M099S2]MCA2651403.1 J domain-containing protein [Microcystis sp. M065S2]
MTTNPLNSLILEQISLICEQYSIESRILEDFADFVIKNHRKKSPKPSLTKSKTTATTTTGPKVKPLTLTQLKQAVYAYFEVSNTTELKKSSMFQMATRAFDNINLSQRESWEKIYREYVGILPEEDGETGKHCINGINIFKYFYPYRVFELDPKTATKEDIKNAYYRLSKVYHPDNQETGDAEVFDCLTVMYKSITTEIK